MSIVQIAAKLRDNHRFVRRDFCETRISFINFETKTFETFVRSRRKWAVSAECDDRHRSSRKRCSVSSAPCPRAADRVRSEASAVCTDLYLDRESSCTYLLEIFTIPTSYRKNKSTQFLPRPLARSALYLPRARRAPSGRAYQCQRRPNKIHDRAFPAAADKHVAFSRKRRRPTKHRAKIDRTISSRD